MHLVLASCVQSEPVEVKLHSNFVELNKKTMEDVNSGNSCGMSWITGEEGSVCNGKTLFWTPALRTFSSGKPPLPTSHRKRSRDIQVSQGFYLSRLSLLQQKVLYNSLVLPFCLSFLLD